MLVDRNIQSNVITEHANLKQAGVNQFPYHAHIQGVNIWVTHFAFELKEYEMDFGLYLEEHRDPKHLPRLLESVIQGVESLHQLGLFHRDLKPDNIMISLQLLTITIIDFDFSHLRSALASGSVRGTIDYYLQRPTLRDGSTTWDVWAFAAKFLRATNAPESITAQRMKKMLTISQRSTANKRRYRLSQEFFSKRPLAPQKGFISSRNSCETSDSASIHIFRATQE